MLDSFLLSLSADGLAGYALGTLANQLFIILRGWPAVEVALTIMLALRQPAA